MPEVVNYDDARGREPVDEYVAQLLRAGERTAVAAIGRYVELLERHGAALRMPIARIIDRRERIYELRARDHRIAFAAHREQIVLLHAWRKQTEKLDQRHASTARRRLVEWRARHPRA